VGNSARREYTRFKINAPVTVCLQDRAEALMLQDISARGMCAVASAPLDVNKDVEVSFTPPVVINPMVKEARVVWCKNIAANVHKVGFLLRGLELDNFTQKLEYSDALNIPQAATATPTPESKERDVAVSRDRNSYKFLKAAFIAGAVIVGLSLINLNKTFFATVLKAGTKAFAFVNKDMFTLGKDINLELQGIMYSASGESFATINGFVYREGETIQNMTVKKITKDSVVLLARNNQEKVLSIEGVAGSK